MAANKHTASKDPEKSVDVPPYGSRNPDPVTDSPGSHPIETGIGAAVGGIASGAAVGAVGGPVGAVVGAIVGGTVAGGLAGKGVGELIDPTTEDNWLREWYDESDDDRRVAGSTADTYRSAYRYGVDSTDRYTGKSFADAETDLRSEWDRTHAKSAGLTWAQARPAVHHAFDRTVQLREERLRVQKEQQQVGEVDVRKEVHTEHKTVRVPVEREEVVIERRPAAGAKAGEINTGDLKAEEIRIPVREEKVHVSKDTVVKEEVKVGKRKVHDTETVSADLKEEELKVEQTGDVKVRGKKSAD